MKKARMFVGALLVALLLAAPLKAQSSYSGWFYDIGWWWPFSYCMWSYTDYGNGNWWYWDTCGSSYGYMSLN